MSIDNEMAVKLHTGYEYMESEMIFEIKQFEDYSCRTKPIVTILCSENRQRMAMNILVNNIDDVDFYVCGTYNDEDMAEAMNKALYSDAIIVNTTALKIAPKGLYDVLESISSVDKEIYIMLSGWASLPKTKELSESKTQKAIESFSFAKINACKNAFDKPMDGFTLTDELIKEYIGKILLNYDHTHKTQENAIYKKLYKKVREFCDSLVDNIRLESNLFDTLQTVMEFKKRRYEISFSNNTVNVDDASALIESSVNQLSRDEVIYSIEKEMGIPSKKAFIEDSFQAQNIAKKYVADTIINAIDEYKNNGDSSFTIKSDSKISTVTDDLTSVLSNINKCRFVDVSQREQLLQYINETEKLGANSDYIGCSFSEALSKIMKAIEPKIMSFEYKIDNNKFISKAFNTLLSNVDDIVNRSSNQQSEYDECSADNLDDSIDDANFSDEDVASSDNAIIKTTLREGIKAATEENAEDTAWNTFQNETDRLITESKAALSGMLYDYTKAKNHEISEQSRIVVSEYFEKLIGQIKVISSSYNDLIKRIEDSFV